MRARLPTFVLAASALTFLASLYLTWVASDSSAASNSVNGLLNLFPGFSYDGWAFLGQAAALLALTLAAAAAASILRPKLEICVPLASCAFAFLYLALVNAATLRGRGLFVGGYDRLPVHVGAGGYLGVTSATVAFFAAAYSRRYELAERLSTAGVAAGALTLGLLAAYLLPWLDVHVPHPTRGQAFGYEFLDTGSAPIIFIALFASFGLPTWRSGTSPARRLVTVLAIAVLTGASLGQLGTHWPYEAWMELGCSLGLVALALGTGRGLPISLPSATDAAVVVAGSLLLASLFLPWQKFCAQGACFSTNGWAETYSATAGGLALILAVLLLSVQRLIGELAVAVATYVMATGFESTQYAHVGYGAPLGFAGAALLLVAAFRRLRGVRVDLKRLLFRLVPMLACLSFLAIPFAAFTGQSLQLEIDSPWRLFWLEVSAILMAVRLLGRWLSGPRADSELVLLPILLLALTALDLGYVHSQGISWEGWSSLALCLFLVAIGWVDRSGGLENFRLPEEIWRIDRLPGES